MEQNTSFKPPIPPSGLFPNKSDVPVRPPPIPAALIKRTLSTTESENGATVLKRDVNRWVKVISVVGKYVRDHNEKYKDNTYMHYRWYDVSQPEKEIQAVLYKIVDDKAKQNISYIYGQLTYNEAQIRHGPEMELFVLDVASDPMFDPLTQTARLFGVRTIIEAKMKTKRRSRLQKNKGGSSSLCPGTNQSGEKTLSRQVGSSIPSRVANPQNISNEISEKISCISPEVVDRVPNLPSTCHNKEVPSNVHNESVPHSSSIQTEDDINTTQLLRQEQTIQNLEKLIAILQAQVSTTSRDSHTVVPSNYVSRASRANLTHDKNETKPNNIIKKKSVTKRPIGKMSSKRALQKRKNAVSNE